MRNQGYVTLSLKSTLVSKEKRKKRKKAKETLKLNFNM